MTRRLDIEQMLVVSTSHITPELAQTLSNDPDPEHMEWWPDFSRDEGWIFYAPASDVDDPRYADAPACLQALIEFARSHGCCWLMLDCDGETVPALPTWEW